MKMDCFGRTRVKYIQTKEYMVDKLCSTIESVPHWCNTYCCVCCYYRRRKSIGVIQENNLRTSQGTPVIPIAINANDVDEFNKTTYQPHSNGNSIAHTPMNETPPVSPHLIIPHEVSTPKTVTPHTVLKQNVESHSKNTTEGWSNGGMRSQNLLLPRKEQKVDFNENSVGTPMTTLVTTMQSSPNGVELKSSAEKITTTEVQEKTPPNSDVQESSSGDVVVEPLTPEKQASEAEPKPSSEHLSEIITPIVEHSLKTEELELVDTPDYESQAITTVSRPPSVMSTRSQIIEEELDGETHTVEPDRVSEATQEVLEDISDYEDNIPAPKTPTETLSLSKVQNIEHEPRTLTPNTEKPIISPPRSPTIQEIKALSRKSSLAKSCESLFDRPMSKHDGDNSTETSSDYQPSHLNNTITDFTPIKPQHLPLQHKSKTSHFMKKHRRVSPVKQALKMSQAELYPQSMVRFEKPRDALNKAFDQLDSSNWEINVLGLKFMVRLMRYHPDTLDNQMHMTCIQLTKSVRNLRSQVSRAACQASTELFTMKSKLLEQECDDLVSALLHRTADTNRFLRADATRGLESMCDNLTPPKVLNILCTRGAVHQNAIVKTTTAKLLIRLADRVGCEKIYTMGRENRDRFILTGANLLLEGSLETRSYAKSLFRLLSDHPSYSRLLLEVIPTRTYRNIEKTLKNIR